MKQHFWDLDLSQIPLGWENKLQHAMNTCPNGKYITDENTNETYWYDPVGYKAQLEEIFENLKKQAQPIYDSLDKSSEQFDEQITTLLKIDIQLYNIIFEWRLDNLDMDGSCFDSKKLWKSISTIGSDIGENYFCCKRSEIDVMKPYHKYKFIKLNTDPHVYRF